MHRGARTHTPSVTRGHVGEEVARARALAAAGGREGGTGGLGALLIKAHQGRSFSTGGRVVQQHRDTPAQRHGAQTVGEGGETG